MLLIFLITLQVDIFSHDMILVPIHLGMHWCMSVIDFRSKFIKYYDSVGAPNDVCLDQLLLYLKVGSGTLIPFDHISVWFLLSLFLFWVIIYFLYLYCNVLLTKQNVECISLTEFILCGIFCTTDNLDLIFLWNLTADNLLKWIADIQRQRCIILTWKNNEIYIIKYNSQKSSEFFCKWWTSSTII